MWRYYRKTKKTPKDKRISYARNIVIFLLIILSGCATKEALKNVSDEDILRQRVMAYWNYRIQEELNKSYEMEDPLYRKKSTLVNYIKNIYTNVVKWKSFNISYINIEEEMADVGLEITANMNLPGIPSGKEIHAPIKDRWVKSDGVWYHLSPQTQVVGK
jgi:hypothetical protein